MGASGSGATPAEGIPAELRRSLLQLLWPLRPRPLAVLAATASLALTGIIPGLGPVLILALVAVVVHTGFRAVAHTADKGLADTEPLTLLPQADTVVRSAVFLLVLMAWGALALLAWAFGGPPGGLAVTLMVAGLPPALIVRLGREHALVAGLLDALNPARLIEVMRVTGRAYPIAAGLPLILGAALAAGLYAAADQLALPVQLAAGFLLAGYTALATFRLAACLAARFREELGYARKRPRPTTPQTASPPREPSAQERLQELIKADHLEEAAELLRDKVKAEPTTLYWWQRYYRLLRHLERDAALPDVTRGYLTVLLQAGEEKQAMAVVHEALNRDRSFQPLKPEQVFWLACIARRDDRPSLALRIMNGFVKRCPDHPDAPKVLLFSARIMGEDFRQPHEACRLLDALIQRYPDHPLAAEAGRLHPGFAQAS